MSHPGGAIFTHTADTEYGGVLRVRLYDRAIIKRGCSTRVVPVGVTFARRGDEKEPERRNGGKRGAGGGVGSRERRIRERPRTTLLFSRCYDIGRRS